MQQVLDIYLYVNLYKNMFIYRDKSYCIWLDTMTADICVGLTTVDTVLWSVTWRYFNLEPLPPQRKRERQRPPVVYFNIHSPDQITTKLFKFTLTTFNAFLQEHNDQSIDRWQWWCKGFLIRRDCRQRCRTSTLFARQHIFKCKGFYSFQTIHLSFRDTFFTWMLMVLERAILTKENQVLTHLGNFSLISRQRY